MNSGYGLLFGLFPVNALHNLVHLGIGVLGILAYTSYDAARAYSRGLAIAAAYFGWAYHEYAPPTVGSRRS